MVGRLNVGRLNGVPVGRMRSVGYVVGRLHGQSFGRMVGRLNGRSISKMVGRSVKLSGGQVIGRFAKRSVRAGWYLVRPAKQNRPTARSKIDGLNYSN